MLNPEISFLNASVEGHEAMEWGCELSLGSRVLCLSGGAHRLSPRGSRISHATLHCDLESVGSNALPRMVKPWGLGLGNTLNCCSVTVKGEDTGQVSREEASETLFGQLHFEPTGPGKS